MNNKKKNSLFEFKTNKEPLHNNLITLYQNNLPAGAHIK